MKRKGLLLSIVVWILLMGIPMAGLTEEKFPTKPIKLIIAYAPGGSTDASARALAKGAEEYLGQPIVCENYAGAGGLLAMNMVVKAKPDGYTLGTLATSAVAWQPFLKEVTYDPLKDFTPILQYCAYLCLVSTKSDAPFKTAKELIEYSRQHPGLKFSTSSSYSMHDIVQYIVAKKAGVKWSHVPYAGGIPAITAVLGGHVSFVASTQEHVPYIQSGQLIPLVTHSDSRSKFFPNLPTWRDVGYPVGADTRAGLAGPAGIPKPVVQKLVEAFKRSLEKPAFTELMEKLTSEKIFVGPEEFQKFNAEQFERTYTMLKELDVPMVRGLK